MNIKKLNPANWLLTASVAAFTSMTLVGIPLPAVAALPPNVIISTVPLNVVIPSTPQVLIALTNSNSMDSSDNIIDDANTPLSIPAATTTARAPTSSIMTWSGKTRTGWPVNTTPDNYQVPAGYAAPITGVAAGSTLYTAPINTYNVAGTGGGGWTCTNRTLIPITTVIGPPLGPVTSLPNPGGNPPTLFFPGPPGTPSWDPTHNWYYNGVNVGGNNGYYEDIDPGSVTAIDKLPSARQWFHGEGEQFAMYGTGGLFSVGMGAGGTIKPSPRVGGGGGPPPPPPCGPGSVPFVACPPPPPPPPPTYCHEWMWAATYPTSTAVTPIGDNSASRMNVAKESLAQVIATYGTQVDFGLMHYQVKGGLSSAYTWAYYMSPAGGFTPANFSNVYAAPSAAGEWVINPCWGAGASPGDCGSLAVQTGLPAGTGPGQLGSFKYMLVDKSGDDPDVDDVLLAGWGGHYIFMTYGALTDPTSGLPLTSPYLSYGLANYNCSPSSCPVGTDPVAVKYPSTAPFIPGDGTFTLTPTNSGYVPFSSQVLFSLRGYLWSGNPWPDRAALSTPVIAPASASAADQAAYLQQFTTFLTPENNVPPGDTGIIPLSNPAISYYNYYKNAIFSWATQSPIAGMLSTALQPSSWLPPGPPGTCLPAKYVILMTDGLPTMDLAGNSWPPPGSAAAAGYGATVGFNGDGTLNFGSTNNQAVKDTITEIAALQAAGINVFVVGMGLGASDKPSAPTTMVGKTLNAMAHAGGTGNYYAATSPAAVVGDLNAILTVIASLNVDSVSGAVNSTGLNTGSTIYQASYTGYDKPDNDWTGNVFAYPVYTPNQIPPEVLPPGCTDASVVCVSTTASWQAKTQLDAQNWDTGRNIVTCAATAAGICSNGSGEPFRWSNISAAQQAALNATGADTVSLMQDRLNYLRGDTSNYGPGGDNFRPRSHILGDIVDSAAMYVAESSGPYSNMPGYTAFASSTATRAPMIYVGANDGMLHAFDAATGNEKFAFIPNGVFATAALPHKLAGLSDPNYNSNHQFYVDGSPTGGDVQFADNSWHTVLVGGLNDGGNSIYALDITDPTTFSNEPTVKNDVLWEFTDPNLGLTYSQPVLTLTNDKASTNANPHGFLAFFGSGYNNSSGNPYLYAVNAQTGKLVSKDVSQVGKPLGGINLCAAVAPNPCLAGLPNGLSGVTVVNNQGVLGDPVTTVYAGDLQGNLWKVDVTAADPKNWVVTLLFQARDALGNPQPITVTPAVSLNPSFPRIGGTVVYFGTGQYLGTPDMSTTGVQSFYAVEDNGVLTNLTRAALVAQNITGTGTIVNAVSGMTITARTGSNNAVNWATQSGWFMDLPIPGERVVTNPRLFNGEVVFTTYVPSPAALCAGGGQSYLMVLNYSNGGTFPQTQLDINGDGALDGGDQVAGNNPIGMSLGNVFASAPTIVSANLGNIQAVKLVTLSTPPIAGSGNIQGVGERGGLPLNITWTQLQ
ncbi:MAG: pilus assembly protein [Gammaproteobacteria bacterium]